MGRGISIGTRKELIEVLAQRYRDAGKNERTRILNEFVAISGYHRKHATRLLGGNGNSKRDQIATKAGVSSKRGEFTMKLLKRHS